MKVKGRGISAFNGNLLVENYPLREKSKEQTARLEHIEMLRRIELSAQKTRNELTGEAMRRENINEIVIIFFSKFKVFLF
jgi:hypothetical protein